MMEVLDVHVGPKSMANAQTYNDHCIIKERKKKCLTLQNWPGHLAEQKN